MYHLILCFSWLIHTQSAVLYSWIVAALWLQLIWYASIVCTKNQGMCWMMTRLLIGLLWHPDSAEVERVLKLKLMSRYFVLVTESCGVVTLTIIYLNGPSKWLDGILWNVIMIHGGGIMDGRIGGDRVLGRWLWFEKNKRERECVSCLK